MAQPWQAAQPGHYWRSFVTLAGENDVFVECSQAVKEDLGDVVEVTVRHEGAVPDWDTWDGGSDSGSSSDGGDPMDLSADESDSDDGFVARDITDLKYQLDRYDVWARPGNAAPFLIHAGLWCGTAFADGAVLQSYHPAGL